MICIYSPYEGYIRTWTGLNVENPKYYNPKKEKVDMNKYVLEICSLQH